MEWSFYIPCPANVLWWIICICVIGVMISGMVMLQAGRFTLTREGAPVSMQKLHLAHDADKIDGILRQMTLASRKSLRRGLRGDFLFMPFFYCLLLCISILLRWNTRMHHWETILTLLCYVPLLTWLVDLVENFTMLGMLADHNSGRKPSPGLAWTMATASLLKWISGTGWLIVIISLLIAGAVEAN